MAKLRRGLRSTPKVFNASYQPPKASFNWQVARSLLPAVWLILIVAAFVLIPRLPVFRISDVQVSGTDDTDIVAALNQLKGQPL